MPLLSTLILILFKQISTSKVDINLTCCYPGYSLNDDGTCEHDHDNENIARPDTRRHYIYVQASRVLNKFEDERYATRIYIWRRKLAID